MVADLGFEVVTGDHVSSDEVCSPTVGEGNQPWSDRPAAEPAAAAATGAGADSGGRWLVRRRAGSGRSSRVILPLHRERDFANRDRSQPVGGPRGPGMLRPSVTHPGRCSISG